MIYHIMKYEDIKKDKLLHFYWSSILMIPLITFLGDLWGSISLLVIAIGKEYLYDYKLGKGTPEVMDAVYGTLPAIIYLIIKYVQIFI